MKYSLGKFTKIDVGIERHRFDLFCHICKYPIFTITSEKMERIIDLFEMLLQ